MYNYNNMYCGRRGQKDLWRAHVAGGLTNGEVDCGLGVCPLADVVSQLRNLQFPMDLVVPAEP